MKCQESSGKIDENIEKSHILLFNCEKLMFSVSLLFALM